MQLHHVFLKDLHKTFNKAALNIGVTERYFKVGPYKVHLRFAGKELANEMTPALEHLALAFSQNADLTVYIWDNALTKTEMLTFPWLSRSLKKQSSIIRQINTETVYTTYNEFRQSLSVYDATTQTAFFWVPDARKISSYELSAPLRDILHWFLMKKSVYFIHSGAVGTPEGGILLVGKGGAGKSTSTLRCLDTELSYAGDDYVLVSRDTTPMVYSLYSSAKLHRDNIWRVPNAIPAIVDKPNLKHEKALIFLNQIWPEKLISQFPLRAIFLPHVTDSLDTTLTRATTKEAISSLALSTIANLPRSEVKMVKELIKLTQCIPAYHLKLGTQMEQIPRVILKFLKES